MGRAMKKGKLLTPAECCLHIVDPQQSLMKHIYRAERVIRVIKFMLVCARILEVPIIANTQYKKGLGPYVPELEALVKGVPMVDKKEFGALANEDTIRLIETLPEGITTHILVGVETHICIYQTAMGLLERGLVPWIVADGVSARSNDNHLLSLERLRSVGAVIGPAEMIVYELLGKAGTLQFKEVLPHVLAFSDDLE